MFIIRGTMKSQILRQALYLSLRERYLWCTIISWPFAGAALLHWCGNTEHLLSSGTWVPIPVHFIPICHLPDTNCIWFESIWNTSGKVIKDLLQGLPFDQFHNSFMKLKNVRILPNLKFDQTDPNCIRKYRMCNIRSK